jgi:hypothetical protein
MKILFEKELVGYSTLANYKIKSRVLKSYRGSSLITVDSREIEVFYDLQKICNVEGDNLNLEMKNRGLSPLRTSDTQFILNDFQRDIVSLKLNEAKSCEDQALEKIRTDIEGPEHGLLGLLFGSEIPVYRRIPHIKVSGSAVFRDPNAEPTQILKILKNLSYESEVILTRQEIDEAYNKGFSDGQRAATARCNSRRSVYEGLGEVFPGSAL